MSTYKTTVGLEVHAELKTKSKMFCGCKNNPHEGEPNAHVCPVCMAHPGTLPTINKEAVLSLLKMGTAIGGTLAEFSEFDRKNYFYPDIPKAYQISQYKFPFVTGGEIAGVQITRVHLEEDTARSVHDQGDKSLVDFNRAGVPLLELVTEPVIHTPEEAGRFAKELQLLLRTLGISDANMEKGEMRVEANISVSTTDTFGTKVEVKNINSFKAVEGAIAYEVKRHIEVLEGGGTIVQETRGWDETKSKTFSQRVKETSEEYRYFPDPDLPKFVRSEVPEFSDSRIADITAKNPALLRAELTKVGLSENQIEIIISIPEWKVFFDKVLTATEGKVEPKLVGNYFANDLIALISGASRVIADASVDSFAELLVMLAEGVLTSRVVKDLLPEVVFEAKSPRVIAKERGLLQDNSSDSLRIVVQDVIAQNNAVVQEYKAGKTASIQFLVGQCMKATKGSGNPGILTQLLTEELSK
ncbi:MAG: hypothetical protein RLZZ76_503 [Candidatus Parcubacteria bacterium]|jgi:aspartyl-tRNA(Asn)/glutamyl-tRNA(Gln) amidotransferase subunit B